MDLKHVNANREEVVQQEEWELEYTHKAGHYSGSVIALIASGVESTAHFDEIWGLHEKINKMVSSV